MDLAPDMRPAGYLPDRLIAGAVQFVEPGISVSMQMTGKVFQNGLRMQALAIRAIAIKSGWQTGIDLRQLSVAEQQIRALVTGHTNDQEAVQ